MPNENLKIKVTADTSQLKSSLKGASVATKEFQTKIKTLRAEALSFSTRVTAAAQKVNKLEKELKEAGTKGSDVLRKKLILARKELKKLSDASKKAGTNLSKFQKTQVKAIKSTSRFKKGLSGLKAGFVNALKAITPTRIAMAAFAIGLIKVISSIREGVTAFLALNKAYSAIDTLFSKGTLTKETKKFIEAQAIAHGQDAIKSAKAYYDIVSAGITDQSEANKVLEASMKLAVAGVTDVASASKGIIAIMNSWGHESYTAAKASDLLFLTVKRGITTLPELVESFARASSILAAFGISAEQGLAMLSTMTSKTTKTNQAVTQLAGIFQSFAMELGKDSIPIIQKLGYAWDETTAKAIGPLQMFKDLHRVTGGMPKKIRKIIKEKRALNGFLQLASNGFKTLTENTKAFGKAGGTTAKAFSLVAKTIAFKTAKANEELQKVKRSLGESWAETGLVFTKMWTNVLKFTESIVKLIAALVNYKRTLKDLKKDALVSFQNTESTGSGSLLQGTSNVKKPDLKKIDYTELEIQELKKKNFEELNAKQRALLKKEHETANLIASVQFKMTSVLTKTHKAVEAGLKVIRAEVEKIIEKIKERFSGKNYGAIAEAKNLLSDPKVKSIFDKLANRLKRDPQQAGGFTPNAIRDLAKAAEIMSKLSSDNKRVFELLAERTKSSKGSLNIEDMLGVAKAIKDGLDDSVKSIELISLRDESAKIKIDEARKEGLQKELELREVSASKIVEKWNVILAKAKNNHIDFKNAVVGVKAASVLMLEAAKDFKKPKKISLELLGNLDKILEAKYSRSRQNKTGDLTR